MIFKSSPEIEHSFPGPSLPTVPFCSQPSNHLEQPVGLWPSSGWDGGLRFNPWSLSEHVGTFLEQGAQREGSRAFGLWRYLRGCMLNTSLGTSGNGHGAAASMSHPVLKKRHSGSSWECLSPGLVFWMQPGHALAVPLIPSACCQAPSIPPSRAVSPEWARTQALSGVSTTSEALSSRSFPSSSPYPPVLASLDKQ